MNSFYGSAELQVIDWKSAFRHTLSLPYSKLLAHLQADKKPDSIRIYSTIRAEKNLWIRNCIGWYTRTLYTYVWKNSEVTSTNFNENDGHTFTAEQLTDKLSEVFSTRNYRVCIADFETGNYTLVWAKTVSCHL